MIVYTVSCLCCCLSVAQSASVFIFDKRFSDKMMLRARKKDTVLEMLRADVSRLMTFRSPHMLRVLHPVEECR